jgi:hypothetical protein
MKIDCLMGTYGRYSLACEALACFLQQSALARATLLIYNQHPVPLRFDHPRVRIVNEPPPSGTMRHIRRRMVELADPAADLLHLWDDDDLYLPWHLEDCLREIGEHPAWKPRSSWMLLNDVYSLEVNWFEATWALRAEHVKAAPLHTHPTHTGHPVFRQTWEAGLVATTELAGRTSYIYRWGGEVQHISGYGGGSEDTQRKNLELWRLRSRDVRADGVLVPPDLTPRWRHYLEGIKGQVTAEEWECNRKGCRLP